MIFEKDTDVEQALGKYLSPDKFLKYLASIGEITTITKDYGVDIHKLCRNAVAWAILQLRDTSYIYDIEVVEGDWDGDDHAWLKVGDYYIDLTLAQFIKAPRLAISLATDENYYNANDIYSPMDWIQMQ